MYGGFVWARRPLNGPKRRFPARAENEKQLAELAQLQLRAREQRQLEQQRAFAVREIPKVDYKEEMENEQLVQDLRHEYVVGAQQVADRIKTERAAAREQLRREKMAADRERVDK